MMSFLRQTLSMPKPRHASYGLVTQKMSLSTNKVLTNELSLRLKLISDAEEDSVQKQREGLDMIT